MSCPCDIHVFPTLRRIPAGLRAGRFQVSRALGIFPDWRTSTLAAIGREAQLDDWRAREPHDLGLMLVEMGAYVFDVCDFYDALVAGEAFLNTAQLAEAQRRLVALLGYVPRPAIGAQAALAVVADGTRVVALPKGVGFQSGAFDSEAPQMFELTEPASLEPRVNKLLVDRVPQHAITGSTLSSLLVDPASLRLRVGDPLVVDFNGTLRTTRAASIVPAPLRGRVGAARLTFTAAVAVPAGATYSTTRILGSGGTRGLWKLGQRGADTETAIDGSHVLLESLASVRAADIVLFERDGTLEVRRVSETIERQRVLFPTLKSTLKDTADKVTGSVESAPVTMAISRVSLTSALAWSNADVTRILVHHPLGAVARVLVPMKDTLEHTDPIRLPALIDPPRANVAKLLLEDVHKEGVLTAGTLNHTTHLAQLNQGENWGKTLTAAVTLYGNVLSVSRGETVLGEPIGVGDGSQATQIFKLSKKPLTYLSAPTASGYKSTLEVRVDGIRWHEVESFYGRSSTDRVYTVRHDEKGETFVHFGGASRLPTGAAVTADYRFGAGAAVPPAGSITQVAKPVPGITSVRNVLPAFGGGDAESPRELAYYGPRSALLLGRAISLPDLEAAAAISGVQAARASWHWDDKGLRAVAQVQFIGDEQLIGPIRSKLRALTETDAPISVVRCLPQQARLAIAIDTHPDYVAKDVIAAVREALYHKPDLPGTGGLLRPDRLGPEGVVFLSEIAEAVMAVDGVTGMQSVSFDWVPFVQYGKRPQPNRYFDFGEPGTVSSRLVINGVA